MDYLIIGIIGSYLIGSIPTAYLFGRCLKGIDIRKFGSGNVGATNALRVLGKGPGISVLIIDIFKGLIPVVFLGNFIAARVTFLTAEIIYIIIGLACICGHSWTIFLNFKGGKGIATTFGALFGLAIITPSLKAILGLTMLTWFLVFILVRIISVASILSAIALPIFMVCFKKSPLLILFSIILSALIILRHKSNLKRIFQGKESRITFKKY